MLDDRMLKRIRAAAGLDAVSTTATDLRAYASDLWPRVNVLKLAGEMPTVRPDAIVWARNAEAVARVVAVCAEAGIPVIPWGEGSGVCGGTVPVKGGVALDVKRMNAIKAVDDVSLTVVVEAGINGQHLEDALNERGFSLGHFPSSIMCSTVGGWVACRSAGQYSSRYGKIEDMVLSMDVVLPDGSLVTLDGTSAHPGSPDWTQLVLGSEGTLGIVVRVTLRIHPLPATRRFAGFRFMDLDSGLEAMRGIMQEGLQPSVLRLYDPLDTFINNFNAWLKAHGGGGGGGSVGGRLGKALGPMLEEAGGMASSLGRGAALRVLEHPAILQHAMDHMPLGCMLIIGFEGDDARTRQGLEAARAIALAAAGRDLGPEPGEHWYKNRYAVSFKLPKVFAMGAFADTMEVSGVWRDVPRIYRAVRNAIRNRVAVMAHFSHAYREGCALYFTFAGAAADPKATPELYDWTLRMALGAAMDAGSTASHHHGVGLMKRDWTAQDYRGGARLFTAVKDALDPAGILNPQKIYPPSVRPAAEDNDIRDDDHGLGGRSWESSGGAFESRPEVPDEVPEILKAARMMGRKLTVQTAGVARRPTRDGMIRALDLSRLDEIVHFDPVSGTVTVLAGMTVRQLENFLKEKGFTLGYAPELKRSLTVGSFLSCATPAEGSPLYGTIRENCIGLSAVMADGTALSVRPAPRRASGPDLMHCLIGCRGRFGVITAACFRIFPIPSRRETVAYATDDPAMAVSALRTILVRGVRPEWALAVVRAPSQLGNRRRVRLVVQCGGPRETVSSEVGIVRDVFEPLAMDEEFVRGPDRLGGVPRAVPSVERWVSMRQVMELAARVGRADPATCPEAHVTHLSVHGGTFRLLLRDEAHRYPAGVHELLQGPPVPEVLTRAADRLKELIDPDGVLNPPVVA